VFSRRSIEGGTFFIGYNVVSPRRARGELVVPVPVPVAPCPALPICIWEQLVMTVLTENTFLNPDLVLFEAQKL
jgi:NADH:ubiquinone oxidoreductase subunit B-like Fe-S oxidoreductase